MVYAKIKFITIVSLHKTRDLCYTSLYWISAGVVKRCPQPLILARCASASGDTGSAGCFLPPSMLISAILWFNGVSAASIRVDDRGCRPCGSKTIDPTLPGSLSRGILASTMVGVDVLGVDKVGSVQLPYIYETSEFAGVWFIMLMCQILIKSDE
ncbi:uncharacterized protein LOC120353094 [Nilaparvata lugens]|uniref:uncharacterized protein LOC120353094 n=1 Tax=Nilaparvata lugens TaxID=108931 RepID=UPI00193E5D02|nr:uncharacterized protein LOC120353094 [Nilaparvata lugens]